MEAKVNFEVYDGAAEVESHKLTEPNQALQRTNMLVTDHAPRQARASLSLNVRQNYSE